jgi:hypothetical protein
VWKIEKLVSKGDYTYAVIKEHPNATKHGYVLEHRIVVENHLGRILDPNEVVHHINSNKKDNRLENLELMTNEQHAKEHALKQGRKFVILRCPNCGERFTKPKNQSFLQKKSKYTCCSRRCRGQFSRKIQLQGITTEVEQAISGNLIAETIRFADDNPEETD